MNLDGMIGSMGTIITLAVAVPFLLVALFLGGIALRGRRKTRASQNWPSSMGRVLAAYVDARRSTSSGGTSTAYYPVVLYEYNVDGKPYQGQRISFGLEVGSGWRGQAEKKIASYPPGSMVEVFFNPQNPAEAVLEKTAPANRWLTVAVVFILGALACTALFTLGLNGFIGNLFGDLFSQLPR